ncbi:putative non-specific polyamine oxidase [Helianthus annuus]|uniref:Non-specific polyamine oxidase n=1 Tax=Helianthus annuus TaxID=4232 RepID=A0A9K3EMP7_HELAN|nr:probable polyamine oxidase 5 [Helianthus annuus]KAF5776210.1 putative non-specific polyamine oxidase [Helianthus annuus]KAJ0676801.1 putative non-specific polyamine oxidase [Helianthus annuus]
MVIKKPRIVIIGAGMAGLTAANKLYKSGVLKGAFEVCVVEGGNRIGGRINTSEFGGDRIEMGATWIHGIGGSPVHKIAQEINALESDQPWECMDGFLDDPLTIAENGYVLNPPFVDPVSNLFNSLMDFAQGKKKSIGNGIDVDIFGNRNGNRNRNGNENRNGDESGNGNRNGNENGNGDESGNGNRNGNESVGSFLRKGLECYWKMESRKETEGVNGYGDWNKKSLEEAIFAMHENTQRTYTAANDLYNLDYSAESEYVMCPGEEITIAKGYSSIIESLASVLPYGVIQLNKKVKTVEWQPPECVMGDKDGDSRPVKIQFLDGTSMSADHVIVTVSLGVLKAGIFNDENDSGVFKFDPPLPNHKTEAISRLGFGVVNKLFLKLSPDFNLDVDRFPFLQMVFHKSDDQVKNPKIPWWIRKTASLSPIYKRSSVLLSWFAGEEALKLEELSDEVILDEVSTTVSSFFSHKKGYGNVKFDKALKSRWASDPLFMGSYSYIAVGSSIGDMDSLAEPLPNTTVFESTSGSPPFQILFAGEATHRTHYSTTHGAYFSGIREANRLLQHYHCIDDV